MLEIRDICKTYRPKNGPPVQALKSVSVKFAEKGLVFILGKSGCGKSTLLNTIGGLDSFDSGEIIIKGKSSKEFTGSDFDSYRNTFIGFIFQEYNILSEFNIEKNIALALELQGKKATPEAVQHILDMVDLGTMGKRKTTELSGGQKQRVAIARALIKEPEIIIADEPTGALDSATGIQVFDTLKKLAQDKLVIVVSHDREFAEIYGDRIIEMKDGVIISDETKRKVAPSSVSDDLTMIGEDLIHIKKGHKFSADEKEKIIKFIESRDTETIISVDPRNNQKFKQVAKVDENNHTEKFTETTDADRGTKQYNKNELKLIKSRLKFKDAFKIGASGLKSKPIRLAFTILLSLVAFTLFGFVDSLSAYNKVNTTVTSIVDGDIKNLAFKAEQQYEETYTDWETGEEEIMVNYDNALLTNNDIYKLNNELGLKFKGVYSTSSDGYYNGNYQNSDGVDFYNSYLKNKMSGFIHLTKQEIDSLGFQLTGDMPENSNEIVITEYTYRIHTFAGYYVNGVTIGKSEINYNDDGGPNSIIGKKYYIDGEDYTIVGVVDTGFNYEKYSSLDPTNRDNGQSMASYMLLKEIDQVVMSGYHAVVITHEDFLTNIEKSKKFRISQVEISGNYISSSSSIAYDKTNKVYKNADTAINEDQIFLFDGYTSKTPNASQVILDIRVLHDMNYAFFSSNLIDIYNAFNSYSDNMLSVINSSSNLATLKAASAVFNKEYHKITVTENDGNLNRETQYDIIGFYVQDTVYNSDTENVIILNASNANHLTSNKYSFVITQMPTEEAKIKEVVEFFYDNYNEETPRRYVLSNEVSSIVMEINDMLESLSSVLIWVGLAFCLFAALMLMNFISTSISYKKREIGILRAIGARKKDVFSIFYYESLIIAMINFVLSIIATFTVVTILNNVLRNEYGLVITILNFGVRQVAILLGVSILVAIISSLLPVMKIAKKQPIDAINNR